MKENTNEIKLNEPKKDYCEPMHTTEHILNRTMDILFDCGRAFSAHVETKKSKCDYHFEQDKIPTKEMLLQVEAKVNEIIKSNLPVTEKIVTRAEAAKVADLSKLPQDASEMLRLIYVGDYDVCPCIGKHVSNTSEITGTFSIISSDYNDGVFRLRWKVK